MRGLRSRWVVCVGFGALLALPAIAALLAVPAAAGATTVTVPAVADPLRDGGVELVLRGPVEADVPAGGRGRPRGVVSATFVAAPVFTTAVDEITASGRTRIGQLDDYADSLRADDDAIYASQTDVSTPDPAVRTRIVRLAVAQPQ